MGRNGYAVVCAECGKFSLRRCSGLCWECYIRRKNFNVTAIGLGCKHCGALIKLVGSYKRNPKHIKCLKCKKVYHNRNDFILVCYDRFTSEIIDTVTWEEYKCLK